MLSVKNLAPAFDVVFIMKDHHCEFCIFLLSGKYFFSSAILLNSVEFLSQLRIDFSARLKTPTLYKKNLDSRDFLIFEIQMALQIGNRTA